MDFVIKNFINFGLVKLISHRGFDKKNTKNNNHR